MKVIKVTNKQHIKAFLHLPIRLYKNDKNWIRPLDKDIESVFDPETNPIFEYGEAIRWILANDEGEIIARVAAFINRELACKDNDQPTGGMGFFECINDQKAADLLFDTCKKWLEERGMAAMDGPINFGERDRWWGCLKAGFVPANYCMPYNFAYYNNLFENYGFKTYFQQYTYHRLIAGKPDELIYQKAGRIYKNPNYTFAHLRLKHIDKYTEDFRTIYNEAWATMAGTKAISRAKALEIMQAIKPIIDEEIIWFAYYCERPIAFYVMLPELNQVIRHLNGKFDWWAKLKLFYYLKIKGIKKIFGVTFGVVPRFQSKGVEAAIIVAFSKVAHVANYRYKEIEMNWIGDFNPQMIKVAKAIGSKVCKTHITYRKLFDESKPFKRMKIT